jgi:hypothetical protein
VSPELTPEQANYYLSLIGILHWMVEIGRVDMITEVSKLASYPTIDMSVFKQCDWKEFYGNVKEPVPGDAPKPLGREVDLRLFVDSDHAGDHLARRSRTGFFIFMNMAPILWLSHKQATIETSVFGAEFVAMKQGMETMR